MEKKRESKVWWIKLCTAIFCVLFTYYFSSQYLEEAPRRVVTIFVFAACFWTMEIIPLYATSLVVILLLILSLCIFPLSLGSAHKLISYKSFFASFGNPVIILFLGGFVLARIMNKYSLDKLVAHSLIKLFGNSPYRMILGFMLTTAFLSMWVSNTATTAMMLAMIQPFLKEFKDTDPFQKALILSIPFGANIGGMGTPVGTPPNAIALGLLADKGHEITFISWMVVIIPLVIITLFIASLILYRLFPSVKKEIHLPVEETIKYGRRAKQAACVVVCIIFFWLTTGWHHIPEAVTALFAIAIFSSFGFLTKSDFKKLHWDVLILMWGGFALGKGIQLSQMSEWLLSLSIFSQEGYGLVILFALISLILSSFMSHTVAANLLFPILLSTTYPDQSLLVIAAALASSFAMAFPISTPPNAMAFSISRLRSVDMIKAGLPISLIGFAILVAGARYLVPFVTM